ncbi:MAG: nucleotidyltransferase domain-containing protein [Mariprofundales bacterium]
MKPEFGLSQCVIAKIHQVLSTHPEVETAIVYGSRAKGNYKVGSDIDITMQGDALDLTLQSRIAIELDDLDIPYQCDLSILSNIHNPDLLNHIERVGIAFYEGKHRE